MKSVRLDRSLESRLEEAARISGCPVSTIIRQAIEERCRALLSDRLDRRLADVIGSVASKRPTDSGKIEQAFTKIVKRKLRRRR
jgi:predicted transcriptional regulator